MKIKLCKQKTYPILYAYNHNIICLIVYLSISPYLILYGPINLPMKPSARIESGTNVEARLRSSLATTKKTDFFLSDTKYVSKYHWNIRERYG